MARQQVVGRAPNLLDYFQMRALARNTPNVAPRDIEGETRLKMEIIKAIAELDKTEADVRKAMLSGMTDMATKFATAQASMLGALADEAKAQAMTADAKANVIKTVMGKYDEMRGQLAAGLPEEGFADKLRDPQAGIAPVQTGLTSALSNPNSETYALIQELAPKTSAEMFDGEKFNQLADALDQQFVTGANGMVSKVSPLLRGVGNDTMLAANIGHAARSIDAGIAAAVDGMQAPPEVRQQLRAELTRRAAERLQNDAVRAAGGRNIFAEFAQGQQQANTEMRRDLETSLGRMGAGISPKLKSKIMGDFDKITGMLTSSDPVAQLQVAERRLSERGLSRPAPLAADATPEAKAAYAQADASYKAALKDEYARTIPMEGFAQRMSDLPVGGSFDESRRYLKDQLAAIGKADPDAMTAATARLRSVMGSAQFDAWRRMVGADTDEDAARAAAADPTKLSVFRRVAGTEQAILTNPEQYRDVVTSEARAERDTAEANAKQRADDYAREGAAIVQPREPGEPYDPEAPANMRAAAREKQQAKLDNPQIVTPATSIDTRKWDITSDLNSTEDEDAMVQQAQSATRGSARVVLPDEPTEFEAAATSRASQRTQLFGPGGLMGQKARGAQTPAR